MVVSFKLDLLDHTGIPSSPHWYLEQPRSQVSEPGGRHLIGCEEADPDMSGHVVKSVSKSIKCLSSSPVLFSAVRNFERSKSRSFRRLNRAFSVLRRTKSGNAVSNETSEERDNARNSNVPQEGMDNRPAALLFVSLMCIFVVVLCFDVTAAFALHDSQKRDGSTCVCVCLHCSLSWRRRRVTRLGALSVTGAYVSLIIQLHIA